MSMTKNLEREDLEGFQRLAEALADVPDPGPERHLSDEEFVGYAADSLSREVVRELELHLESCEDCAREVKRIAAISEAFQKNSERLAQWSIATVMEQVRSENRSGGARVEKFPEPRSHTSGGTVSRSRGGLVQESVRRHILLEKLDVLVRSFPPRWRGFEEARYRMLMAIGAGVDQSIDLVSQASGLEPPEGLEVGEELWILFASHKGWAQHPSGLQPFENLEVRHLASGAVLPQGATFESWLRSPALPGMIYEFVKAAHDDLVRVERLLLSKGAEMDIFCAAILGKVEVIEPLVANHPELARARGAHGIPLSEPARAEEQDEAVELLRYYGTARTGRLTAPRRAPRIPPLAAASRP